MLRKFVSALLAPLLAVVLPLMSTGAAAQTAPMQTLPDFADLAERVGPAVVGIRTTARARSIPGAEVFEVEGDHDACVRLPAFPATLVRACVSVARRAGVVGGPPLAGGGASV